MGKVTALMMDVITEKSGHVITPMAVSVCLTPAAPAPLPIPYPVIGNVGEGLTDAAMRSRVNGAPCATVGSVVKTCHGNEPGTLKEVVSLNTAGPCFIIMGAPIVLLELGMMGITTSPCISNKAITVGTNGAASGAGGASAGGSGSGSGGGGGAGPSGPSGPSNGGGGGGGSNSGAGGSGTGPGGRASGEAAAPGTSSGPAEQHTCQGGHPVDLVTGAVVDTAVDLELPGRIPFVFKRNYSSLRYRDRAATLGPGWAHLLEERVTIGPRSIVFREKEGREVFFDLVEVGGSTFHRRERLTLHREGASDFSIRDHAAKVTKVFRPLVADGAAMLRTIRDGYDNAVELDYEGGRLVRVRDTADRDVLVRWRASRIVRLEVVVGGSPEQWVDYEYDEDGRLTAVVDALGHAETYEYDGFGRMIATTTKAGVRFGYTYDPDTGRCIRTGGPNGLYELELDYDVANERTIVHGEEPRVIEWAAPPGHARRTLLFDGRVLDESAWDPDGYRVAVVNGAGEGTQHWYDARGNEIRRVDPMGRATIWEYDADDNVTRRIDPDGAQTTFSHDRAGGLLGVRHSFGKYFVFARDDRGRLVQVSDEGGVVRTYGYDAQHNVIAETDARGATTRFAFDALGRATSRTDALARVSAVSRDRMGRPVAVRRPDGTTVQRAFDAGGRVVRQVNPDGAVLELGWSGMGKLARLVDADGRSWRLEYTSQERLARVTNPSGHSYSYRYDEAGRLAESTTFDERTTRFARDAAGRVRELTLADGARIVVEHDRAGQVLSEHVVDGSTTTFRRDAQGRIVEATIEEGGHRHTTWLERDARGRIVAERQGDRMLRYAYDLDGALLERTLFDGTTTRYTYDPEALLTSVEHAGRTFHLDRDARGRETALRDGRGAFKVESRYDALDRLLEQRAEGPLEGDVPSVLVQRQYTYDRAGRVTRIDDGGWGKSTFTYDVVGRLVEATVGAQREVFHYDPAGSLLGALRGLDKPGGRPPKWKLGAGNRLLETESKTYQFDEGGRRTFARDKRSGAVVDYVWDARDRLREVKLADGTRVVMSYDAFGRRVRKDVVAKGSTHTTEFLWHGDFICADLSVDRGVRSFVHHPQLDTPLLHCEKKEVFLVVTDHLGVPKELIDSAGRVAWAARHDPWGRVLQQRWDPVGEQSRGYRVTSPFRLLGQYADDETGLTSTRFRFFDPEVGRWCSPDPLGLAGGLDLHGFDGTPTVHVDPLGLSTTGSPHSRDYTGYTETETMSGRAVRDPTARWDEFLGPDQTNIDPRDGLPDPDRIWSADGSRSIRYGEHEMNSSPTMRHYHEETWDHDNRTVSNVLQRTPAQPRRPRGTRPP
jgi:RHS repeat-associated protein